MDIHSEIYDFASSAGALEGYVFLKEDLDAGSIDNWIQNLVKQYHALPAEVRESFQAGLDRTLGRAVRSIAPILGDDHPHICALKSLTKGALPHSSRDFEQEKDEKARKYGNRSV
jgi:hypothetical protein